MLSRQTKKNRQKRVYRRLKKQSRFLWEISSIPRNVHKWSSEEIEKINLVFNGAVIGDTTNYRETSKPWKCLNLSNGDLFVPNYPPPEKGLTFARVYGSSLPRPFILVPRLSTLQATGTVNIPKLWDAFYHLEHLHKIPTIRGKGTPIFGPSKYVGCVGSQPRRAGVGVRTTSHVDKLDDESWDLLLDYIFRVENLFGDFVDLSIIRMIRAARKLITFSSITRKEGSFHSRDGSIFGAFAFGINLHLPAHVDRDFTFSAVCVHQQLHRYTAQDPVVVYFCFPRLGVAIPLKPGDIIIFNPQEPHSVSSRCQTDDEILCMSLYLKTAVVGLNDNSIPNTFREITLSQKCKSLIVTNNK
jgi:hypothetical protein